MDEAASILFVQPPSFRVMFEPVSGNLAVRVQGYGYSALLANRQPASIGKLSGTGLASPTWT